MTKLERIIITKTPLAFLLKKSKQWYLPGFEGVPLYDVIKFFYRQVKTVGFTERASAIAYNFIMAIPPSFLFLFTLIPHLPFISKKSLTTQLHNIIYDIIPAKQHNQNIINFIDSFIKDSKIYWWNYVIAIGFGLIHGMGFSTYFRMMFSSDGDWLLKLFKFNVGVEIGQIVILSVFLLLGYIVTGLFKVKQLYWMYTLSGISLLVAIRLIFDNLNQ